MSHVETTTEEIQAAFTEWDRRYRKDPDKFMNEAKRLLTESASDYGQGVTPYFLKLLGDVSPERPTHPEAAE